MEITFDKQNNVLINGVKSRLYVREGAFHGTTDDRLGRWYVGVHGEFFRPYGYGYLTRMWAVNAHPEWMARVSQGVEPATA